jgi:signal transduction histidine kinase
MSSVAKSISKTNDILLGIGEPVAHRLACEIERFSGHASVIVTPTFLELRQRSTSCTPGAILVDYQLLDRVPPVESIYRLAAIAPVIVVAPSEWQTEIATLVASGNVDFVARFGDFVPLAASLIGRWISKPSLRDGFPGSFSSETSSNMGEIFRHEINNPLTGILGNAELLLAHRDRLPTGDTQRLQTVVDLAVRLRETIRRLSNSWEAQSHASKSL